MGNTGKIVLGTIVGLLVIVVFTFFGKYNSMVAMEESVNAAWSQVENQYQRRLDLIPNIVSSVKGEANFEKSTLEAVVNARASATKMNVNVNDAKEMAEFQNQQQGISQALSRLLMVTENYPNLKANQAFADLRVSLEGTENRISTERMRYNESVQQFNTYIRLFPNNVVSGMFGFAKKNLFESDKGANTAPKVDFTN
ncbi:MAG: LemA family protein [Candidatus Gracilibacteria bacterium]|nr:LemA family protein [Candidatus Gracilibacteria bacterium]